MSKYINKILQINSRKEVDMLDSKITVNPYLTFSGNCREAMTFYKEALDGELEVMTFEGAPVEMPDEFKKSVMHATLRFGDAVIMASDSRPGQEIKDGNGNHISISCNDKVRAEKYFHNLAAEGSVVMPWDKTFWGAMFGMFIDKYGKSWMVNCQLEEN